MANPQNDCTIEATFQTSYLELGESRQCDERVSLAHMASKPRLSQKAFLVFVILFGSLQPAFYDVDMSS
jgi:hypothetical protein